MRVCYIAVKSLGGHRVLCFMCVLGLRVGFQNIIHLTHQLSTLCAMNAVQFAGAKTALLFDPDGRCNLVNEAIHFCKPDC